MQVHVRTNFASSKSAGDRSGAAAGASAVYLERVRDIVYWVVVEYRVSVGTLVRCVGENIDFRLYPDSLRALLYLTVTKSRRLCLKHLRRLLFIHLKDAGMGNRQRASAILQPSEPIQQQNTGILPLPIHYIQHSLPVEGGSHREPLANDLLMYWTAPNWCAHGLAQTKSITNPMYKSFAELF